ncbi:MAG: shikimate kinase [Bacteroidales bacterium]|nr:shikimate kinase [Bacteroidales bacterium]
MPVFLVGFMGCGKTEIGQCLSQMTGLPFFDTDGLIVRRSGLSISDIFEQQGEAAFRRMESELLRQYPFPPESIVATGGGLPCHDDNMAYLNAHGTTVYLDAPEALLLRYLNRADARAGRPLLARQEDEALQRKIKRLLDERRPFYGQAAHRLRVVETAEAQAPLLKALIEALGLDNPPERQ